MNDALTGETKTENEEQQQQQPEQEQEQIVNEPPKEETKDNTTNNNDNETTTDINKDNNNVQEPSTTIPDDKGNDAISPPISSSPKTSGKKVTINDTQSKSPELSPSTYKKANKLYKSMNDDSSRKKLNSTFCEYNRIKKYDHFNSTYQRLQAKKQDRDIKLEILSRKSRKRKETNEMCSYN